MPGTELSTKGMEVDKREVVSTFGELIVYWVGIHVILMSFIKPLLFVRLCARHFPSPKVSIIIIIS